MTRHACGGGGVRRWGAYGAAGVLLSHGGAVYLAKRGPGVSHPGTWSTPGGARENEGEDPLAAAVREAYEEVGLRLPAGAAPAGEHVAACACGRWEYRTFVFVLAARDIFDGRPLEECTDERWAPEDGVSLLPLHPALAASWPELRTILHSAKLGAVA